MDKGLEQFILDVDLDDYDAMTTLWLTFVDATHMRIADVVRAYQQQPDQREHIDRVLIALCGWSLPALIKHSRIGKF